MPGLIIGNGNTRAGEVYLDEMARRRQAALNEANFLQSQQNAQQANDRANQELALNRQRAYAEQQGHYDQMAQQTQGHAMDLAAAQQRALAQQNQAQQFHADELQHQNAQLNQQTTFHHDTQNYQNRSLNQQDELAKARMQEQRDLATERMNASTQAKQDQEINWQLTHDPFYIHHLHNSNDHELPEELRQQAAVDAAARASEIRAQYSKPASAQVRQNGQSQMLDFANTQASAANEPDPTYDWSQMRIGERSTPQQTSYQPAVDNTDAINAGTYTPEAVSGEAPPKTIADERRSNADQKRADKTEQQQRLQQEQTRLNAHELRMQKEHDATMAAHTTQQEEKKRGIGTDAYIRDFITSPLEGAATPQEKRDVIEALNARERGEPGNWKTNGALKNEILDLGQDALTKLKMTNPLVDVNAATEDDIGRLGVAAWRQLHATNKADRARRDVNSGLVREAINSERQKLEGPATGAKPTGSAPNDLEGNPVTVNAPQTPTGGPTPEQIEARIQRYIKEARMTRQQAEQKVQSEIGKTIPPTPQTPVQAPSGSERWGNWGMS